MKEAIINGAEVSSACFQSSRQVKESLRDSKGPVPAGLMLEDLSTITEPIQGTISRARAVEIVESDYNGGPSFMDRVDL